MDLSEMFNESTNRAATTQSQPAISPVTPNSTNITPGNGIDATTTTIASTPTTASNVTPASSEPTTVIKTTTTRIPIELSSSTSTTAAGANLTGTSVKSPSTNCTGHQAPVLATARPNATSTAPSSSSNSTHKRRPPPRPSSPTTTSRRPTMVSSTRKASSGSKRPTGTTSNHTNGASNMGKLPDHLLPEWATRGSETTTQRPYDSSQCGQRPMRVERGLERAGRVVGGRPSHQGELPWSVLIRETTLLGLFVKTKCGGVLIDLKWVITAAHCQPGMFGSLVVVSGEYDLRSAGEMATTQNSQSAGNSSSVDTAQMSTHTTAGRLKPIVRKVKRMIVHRDYNPSNFDNDIALLELETPYQLAPHVVPICLPEKQDEDFIGQSALVAGWGKLSFGGPVPNMLQVARLPVISNQQCQEMYRASGHIKIISDSFLCAGYSSGGQDSCEGDSGGPLQVRRKRDSRWVLVGTVSHGIKCAEPNLPGIYIRTAAYLPWIRSVMYQTDVNKRYGH